MKNLFIFLFLISSTTKTIIEYKDLKFDNPILTIIDGFHGALDGRTIQQCMDTLRFLSNLQHGKIKHNNKPSENKQIANYRTYKLDEETVYLQTLILKEEELTKNNAPKDLEDYKKIAKCLQEMKDEFWRFSEPMMNKANMAKAANLALIKEWTKKQDRLDSHLLKWGCDDEKKNLDELSSKNFSIFCNDLKHFMIDLMRSLPKAREDFKKHCLQEEDWKKFDSIFEKK